MADTFSYDVFLSHNAKDKPRVRRLAERLQQAGLRVWFDEWNVRSGDIIALKVDEGLEQSRVLLLCISPNALASGWVGLERSTAVHRDPANEGRRFIPLLLADCELPSTLRRYKYVDFRQDSDGAFEEVLNACRAIPPESPWTHQLPLPVPEVPRGLLERLFGGVRNDGVRGKKRPSGAKRTTTRSVTVAPGIALERELKGHAGWIHAV